MKLVRSKLAHTTLLLALVAAASACSGDPLGERTITVSLGYESSTNYGPEDATGLATIDTVTGQVDIVVMGLPTLEGDVYEGWLAGGGEDPTTTGRFNTDGNGDGSSSITMGNISERTWERVVLTVEPEPDPSPGPDPRHTIGGNIPPAPEAQE